MTSITLGKQSVTRRQILRLAGGTIGGAAIVGTSSGMLASAFTGTTMTVAAVLDKPSYAQGEVMTLWVTENVVQPDRRKIVVIDSTGRKWTKISDNGVTAVFTAAAGSGQGGISTVTAMLTRFPGQATAAATATYSVGSQWRSRFAGDRQDRVMVGMAVTDKTNSNLKWDQAISLLAASGQFVSVRRCFFPDWITKAHLDTWADWAESRGVYPVISFKVPRDDWAGVSAGKYDADLDLLCKTLKDRAAAGRAPVCVAVHHEPLGDGALSVWARMQEYLSNRFAPWNNVFCFSTISNGHEWGPHRGDAAEVAVMYPRSLVDTLNRNRHILACDTYDSADPTKLDYAKYDRTSLKIAGFVSWARAQGVQRVGLGEFGCHDDIDMARCWKLIQDNKDLFAYACQFNSGQNSRADWRMIPAGYPSDPAVTTYTDTGGCITSAKRLAAGKLMFTASAVG